MWMEEETRQRTRLKNKQTKQYSKSKVKRVETEHEKVHREPDKEQGRGVNTQINRWAKPGNTGDTTERTFEKKNKIQIQQATLETKIMRKNQSYI